MVIREADQARAKASQYRGELCSADHQRYLLHIVRGLLYVEDLIYANLPALYLFNVRSSANRLADAGS